MRKQTRQKQIIFQMIAVVLGLSLIMTAGTVMAAQAGRQS